MKKRKHELVRIQSLIENDRLNTGEHFDELIISDLHKLLSDYFDFRDSPKMVINKFGDKFNIDISLTVKRIRNFGVLPK